MKKILLALSLLTIVAVSGSFEDDKKSCDNNDLKGCIYLYQKYIDKKDMAKAYELGHKMYALSLKGCKEGKKKHCNIAKSLSKVINTPEGSFVVDDIYSGMSKNNLLNKKFEKRKDGLYNVTIGEIPLLLSTLMFGGEISGKHLVYTTSILGKEAEVKVFLTEKSKLIYAVIIEWNNFSMGDGVDTSFAIEKSLDNKYTNGISIDKKDLTGAFMDGTIWKPNKNAKISYYRGMNEQMGMRTVVSYIDSYFLEKNEEESKPAAITNKL